MSGKKAILHFLLQATCKKFYKHFTKERLQAHYVSIADVIIRIAVGNTVYTGAAQLGAGVVGEDIVHHSTLAGCIASRRATKGIVAVLALCYQRAAAMVSHANEQVASCFVCLRKHHVVGLGEAVQQVAARQVLVAKELLLAAVHKSGAVDAALLAVTGADCLLHCAVLGVGVARRATEGVAQLGNEVGVTPQNSKKS